MKKIFLFTLLALIFIYSQSTQETCSEFNISDIKLNHFIVDVDGAKKEFYTFNEDVEKVLEQEEIQLNNNDYLKINFIDDICYVKVIRSYDVILKEVNEIPFSTKIKTSSKITQGFTRVVQVGRPGFKEIEYKITYEEGIEKSREIISETTIKPPKPQIILKGERTKAMIASGRPKEAKKVLSMEATAYTYTGSPTFTGIYPKVGSIAVDPQVIPLGTKLWIEDYGYGVAQDTGKAIKGKKIDVFMETKAECSHWGRRNVKVYVLESND